MIYHERFPDRCKRLGYKGPRSALKYCIEEMGMNKMQTAAQLESSPVTVRRYAEAYGITFPDGHKVQCRMLHQEGQQRRRARELAERSPLEINGLIYYPSETAHRCAMQGR